MLSTSLRSGLPRSVYPAETNNLASFLTSSHASRMLCAHECLQLIRTIRRDNERHLDFKDRVLDSK